MNVALAKVETSHALGEAFAVARARLPGTSKVTEAREAAFDAYEAIGLPSRRLEDWKYTDLRVLLRTVLPLAAAPDAAALTRAGSVLKLHSIEGVRKLVLVDGVFAPKLSDLGKLDKGLTIRTLQDVLDSDDTALHAQLFSLDNANPMQALNGAMMTDGMVIDVAAGVTLSQPLHIIHIATTQSTAVFTRSLLNLGKDANATLVESFVGADGAKVYQSHDATVINVADGARFDHVRLIEDSREAFNIASSLITVGHKSHVNTFGMNTGALVSRYQAVIEIAGQHSQVMTNGVNLLNGRQHGDTTLVMNHSAPDCVSREVFRAVLDDRAHSVFQGRINVRQIAQKTDAKMMTRALLLSDEAEASNKPELEIFADDVACGHGATTGALDDSLLFYLRARGLSEKAAQALLIQAFVGEAIESIVDDNLRELAIGAAERWLEARA